MARVEGTTLDFLKGWFNRSPRPVLVDNDQSIFDTEASSLAQFSDVIQAAEKTISAELCKSVATGAKGSIFIAVNVSQGSTHNGAKHEEILMGAVAKKGYRSTGRFVTANGTINITFVRNFASTAA